MNEIRRLFSFFLLGFALISVCYGQYALHFEGNGYVTLPTTLINLPTAFTVEMWFYPNVTDPNYYDQTLLYQTSGGAFTVTMMPARTMKLSTKYDNNTWYDTYSRQPAQWNQYIHVAATYSSGVTRIYVNGVFQNEVHLTQTGWWNILGHPVYLGCNVLQGATLRGDMDEIRVSDIVRYTEDFTPLTTPFAVDEHTVALWHCDEGSGSILHDASPNHFDGVMLNVTWTANTVVGVEENTSSLLPTTFTWSAYPNPFNQTLTVEGVLPKPMWVELSVYNLQGQLVQTLLRGNQTAGALQTQWHTDGIASGVYHLHLKTNTTNEIRKVTLLK